MWFPPFCAIPHLILRQLKNLSGEILRVCFSLKVRFVLIKVLSIHLLRKVLKLIPSFPRKKIAPPNFRQFLSHIASAVIEALPAERMEDDLDLQRVVILTVLQVRSYPRFDFDCVCVMMSVCRLQVV